MFVFVYCMRLGGFALWNTPILQSPLIGGALIAANVAEASANNE